MEIVKIKIKWEGKIEILVRALIIEKRQNAQNSQNIPTEIVSKNKKWLILLCGGSKITIKSIKFEK